MDESPLKLGTPLDSFGSEFPDWPTQATGHSVGPRLGPLAALGQLLHGLNGLGPTRQKSRTLVV